MYVKDVLRDRSQIKILSDGKLMGATVRLHGQCDVEFVVPDVEIIVSEYDPRMDVWFRQSDDGERIYCSAHVLKGDPKFLPDQESVAKAFAPHVAKYVEDLASGNGSSSDLSYLLSISKRPDMVYRTWVDSGLDYDLAAQTVIDNVFRWWR